MRPLTALAVAGAVAVPWYVLVGLRTDGAWLRGFFFTHNLGRAVDPMASHGGPIFYYPFAVLFGFLPWSVFAAPLVLDLKARLQRNDPWKVGYVLALCWMGVWVAIFSLVRTKAPSYVAPMYPGLALIAGAFVFRWTRGELLSWTMWPKLAMGVFGALGAGALVAVPIVLHYLLPGEEGLALIGLAPLAAAAACLALLRKDRPFAAASVFTAAAACCAVLVFGVAAARVDRHRQIHVLLADVRACSPHPRLAQINMLQPSWVFYGRTPIATTATDDDAVRFLASDPDHFLIVHPDERARLAPRLPADVQVVSRTSLFPKRGEILVLGRRGSSLAQKDAATSTR